MPLRRMPMPLPRLQWVSQPQSGKTRVALDQPCQVRTAAGRREAVVFNISVVGLYLLIDSPLPRVGDTIEVSFALPGSDRTPVHGEARVAWQNPPSVILRGMGSL